MTELLHACVPGFLQWLQILLPSLPLLPSAKSSCQAGTGAGYGSTDCCDCDSHCESESPHPGMWEGELGSKGIPLM